MDDTDIIAELRELFQMLSTSEEKLESSLAKVKHEKAKVEEELLQHATQNGNVDILVEWDAIFFKIFHYIIEDHFRLSEFHHVSDEWEHDLDITMLIEGH